MPTKKRKADLQPAFNWMHTSDDAMRREFLVLPDEWKKSSEGVDFFWGYSDQNEKVCCYINRSDSWARPLVGRCDLNLFVREYKRTDKGFTKVDLQPVHMQPDRVQAAIGRVADAPDPVLPTMTVEAYEAQCAQPPAAVKTVNAPKATHRPRVGRAVQSGSIKPPTERKEPLKLSVLLQNMGEANLLHKRWLEFQALTNNEIGITTFHGMCLMEGVDKVLERFR